MIVRLPLVLARLSVKGYAKGMTGTDDITAEVLEAAQRILGDLADLQSVNAAADDAPWRAPLWSALTEAGLTRAWLPEAAGGAGLGLSAGFAVLRAAGQYACPVPLAETLLGGQALVVAGIDLPEGEFTVPVRGDLTAVPHAGRAAYLVVVGEETMLYALADLTVRSRPTDMGDARGDIDLGGAAPVASAPGMTPAAFETLGAVARSCQIAGGLETALALGTDYARTREAFGRKIAKLQAVQQMLAQLGGEVAAALSASGSAADTLDRDGAQDAVLLETAAAKIRCGEAVGAGARIAHQDHGAIGWTQDYVLQRLTRRMFAWRDDFGAEADWAIRLGRHVAGQGADAVWPMLTAR